MKTLAELYSACKGKGFLKRALMAKEMPRTQMILHEIQTLLRKGGMRQRGREVGKWVNGLTIYFSMEEAIQ